MPGVLRHLAIVMDGNGRWASRHGYPRADGHRRGMETSLRIIEAAAARDITHLSLFALSCENMSRPAAELENLEQLINVGGERFGAMADELGIELAVIGDLDGLGAAARRKIETLAGRRRESPALRLTVAINYSGQWDILQAVNRLGPDAASPVAASQFAACLSTAGLPDPDLLVRTGGERRLSNFMLWQMAYTELYFTDKMWPEFGVEDLDAAIASYGSRERRFGLVADGAEPLAG